MIKKGIICETLGTTDKLQINESKNGEIRLTGVFGVCGVKNNNNRVYEKKNYGECITEMQQRIVSEGILGELEHPNSGNINLNNVSHKIESIQMNEDGTIVGTILLLNTAKGRDAKAIVEGGVPLFISSRASGSIDASGRVNLQHIQTYDLVGTPGFSQARLDLAESQIGQTVCLNESLDGQNGMYMIVESEVSEGGLDLDSSDDKKSDDKKSDSSAEAPTEAPTETPKNSDDDKDMNEIKSLIKNLSNKIDSLESQLHVAQESLYIQDELINELQESQIKPATLEKWLCEEFAPEIQNWIVEEYSPEIQNWIVEEYSPEIQNWIVEEYSPEIQNWIVEEYSPEIQNWIVEEYSPEYSLQINEKANECSCKKCKTEVEEDEKPTTEPTKSPKKKSCVSESFILDNMPSKYKSVWEGLSEKHKQSIIESSKLYNFNSNSNILKFWESKLAPNKVNQVKTAEQQMFNESLINRSANVINPRYAAIFNKAKSMQLR